MKCLVPMGVVLSVLVWGLAPLSGCRKSPSSSADVAAGDSVMKELLAGLEGYSAVTNRFGSPDDVLEMDGGASNLYFYLRGADLNKHAKDSVVGFSLSMENGVIRSKDPITRSGGPSSSRDAAEQNDAPSLKFEVIGKGSNLLQIRKTPSIFDRPIACT